MTSPTDAPRPALGELARLAKAYLDAKAIYDATEAPRWTPDQLPPDWWNEILTNYRSALSAYSSAVFDADVLVALAAGGADTELLDGLLDDALSGMREPMTLADARNVRDMLTRVQVERKKAKVRAARSLTPERPADA